MSTLDQAFVKAFARTQHPRHGDGLAADKADEAAEAPERAAETPIPVAEESKTEAIGKPKGSLVVDPSVAASAIVWIDEQEGQQMRADMAASPTISRPQIADRPVCPTRPEAPAGVEEAVAFAPRTYRVDPPHTEPERDPRRNAKRDVPVDVPPAAENGSAAEDGSAAGDGLVDENGSPDLTSDNSATPPDSAAAAFPAVWEVDHFDMPPIVTELFLGGFVADDLAQRMSTAVDQGLRSVLVSSVRPGEGRSTVAIGIAMSLAAVGYRVALVDADGANPTLADDLRLDIEYGWVDAQRGGLPVEEVAVRSLGDGVTLIPLMPPNGDTAATAEELRELIEPLKRQFHLVVIDGPAEPSAVSPGAQAFDTALIVRDIASTDAEEIEGLSKQLRARGVQGVGVIENFG